MVPEWTAVLERIATHEAAKARDIPPLTTPPQAPRS